jgi:hypothetical protein
MEKEERMEVLYETEKSLATRMHLLGNGERQLRKKGSGVCRKRIN